MNEHIEIAGGPTGGTFTLQVGVCTTRKLPHNATGQEIQAAIDEAVALYKEAGFDDAPKVQVNFNALTGMSSPSVVITQIPDVDIADQNGYLIDHKNGKRRKI